MLMLVLLRRFTESQIQVRAGKQIDFKNSCFENGLPELYGKRIGIIGLGAIGKELVKRLTPFGCVSAITTLYLLRQSGRRICIQGRNF
jgi:lactate dehydrogenase-like 2-hydroxyacid dehydrogenase